MDGFRMVRYPSGAVWPLIRLGLRDTLYTDSLETLYLKSRVPEVGHKHPHDSDGYAYEIIGKPFSKRYRRCLFYKLNKKLISERSHVLYGFLKDKDAKAGD